MKLTIGEMKLRVAGLLPEKIAYRKDEFRWKGSHNGIEFLLSTIFQGEWLEVCRLAVEKLDRKQRESYLKRLRIVVVRRTGKWGLADTDIVDAAAEERIDAIYHAIRTLEEVFADVAEYQ